MVPRRYCLQDEGQQDKGVVLVRAVASPYPMQQLCQARAAGMELNVVFRFQLNAKTWKLHPIMSKFKWEKGVMSVLNQISLFESNVACGNGEQILNKSSEISTGLVRRMLLCYFTPVTLSDVCHNGVCFLVRKNLPSMKWT